MSYPGRPLTGPPRGGADANFGSVPELLHTGRDSGVSPAFSDGRSSTPGGPAFV